MRHIRYGGQPTYGPRSRPGDRRCGACHSSSQRAGVPHAGDGHHGVRRVQLLWGHNKDLHKSGPFHQKGVVSHLMWIDVLAFMSVKSDKMLGYLAFRCDKTYVMDKRPKNGGILVGPLQWLGQDPFPASGMRDRDESRACVSLASSTTACPNTSVAFRDACRLKRWVRQQAQSAEEPQNRIKSRFPRLWTPPNGSVGVLPKSSSARYSCPKIYYLTNKEIPMTDD
jgi:hypothetical protein